MIMDMKLPRIVRNWDPIIKNRVLADNPNDGVHIWGKHSRGMQLLREYNAVGDTKLQCQLLSVRGMVALLTAAKVPQDVVTAIQGLQYAHSM